MCVRGTNYSRNSKFFSLFEFPKSLEVKNQKRQFSINMKKISLVSEKNSSASQRIVLVFFDVTLRIFVRQNPSLKVLIFISSVVHLFNIVVVVVPQQTYKLKTWVRFPYNA